MRISVIYSSLSGNTRQVAEAVHGLLPEGSPLRPVQEAPDPEEYDLLLLGFWVHRAKPDPLMWQYMEKIQNKTVAAFGTLVARPDSDHARKVVENLETRLSGNKILGSFLCQGRLAPKRFEARLSGAAANAHHPLTEERKAALIAANSHPDEEDLKAVRLFFSSCLAEYIERFSI